MLYITKKTNSIYIQAAELNNILVWAKQHCLVSSQHLRLKD